MEHDFTPDEAAPWPDKPEKAGPEEAPAAAAEPDVPEPAGRRQIVVGAIVVLLAAAGGLALLASRESPPAVVAASSAVAPARIPATSTPAHAVASDRDWVDAAPRWASNAEAWLGRNKGAAFEVLSAQAVGAWMRNVRPALVVRCTGKRADVFVFTDSAAALEAGTDDHTVAFAFDDEAPTSMRWPDGAEHNALFAPDGEGLAQRLMLAGTFTFSFTPHNAATVTARFNTSGLAAALKPSARHCGW